MGFSSQSPLFVPDPDAPDSGNLVTAPNKRPTFNVPSFSRIKPNNTYRIFAMGGSTTFGRPYEDSTSFSGWLRVMLPVADASRRWEIINCGGVSYASYRVALLMEELIQYDQAIRLVPVLDGDFCKLAVALLPREPLDNRSGIKTAM